jgi:fibronectin-binding autotransporter adhesin
MTTAQLKLALALSLAILPFEAYAAADGAGGAGGNGSTGAAGGTGGIITGTLTGGNGTADATSGGGGGGGAAGGSAGGNGAAVGGGNGSAGGAHGQIGGAASGPLTGGNGVVGASGTSGGGGGGGGGGFGLLNFGSSSTNSFTISGGVGGNGGASTSAIGGGGGTGGVGLSATGVNATLTNSASVIGGNGGTGGSGSPQGGNGGNGGDGITGSGNFAFQFSIINQNGATIRGGNGGTGGAAAAGTGGNGGNGGAGISGDGLVITNLSGGTIIGGAAGAGGAGTIAGATGVFGAGIIGSNLTITTSGAIQGSGGANAITFTGGSSVLTLQAGYSFTGNVVANPGTDILEVAGVTDFSFDVSAIGPGQTFQNFAGFRKTGGNTVTLTGATTATTPWQITQGVLAISSDAALGDVSQRVTLATGTLRFTSNLTLNHGIGINAPGGTIDIGSTASTISGTIIGPGGLTVSGNGGDLTLTSTANAFSGTTTINSGVALRIGDGGFNGSTGTGPVINNGQLFFNSTTLAIRPGDISGTGSVTQMGSGVVHLNGNNSYSGLTTISAGTLQIGEGATISAGGTTGTLGTGNVVNNSVLAYNRIDAIQYAGSISGTGVVNVLHGNFVLTGPNTYTGGTNIASGATLQLGIPTANGSIAGNVSNSGTLAFNNGSSLTYSGVISGIGQVTKAGSGTAILTGNNVYTGGTTITAGRLQLGNGGTSGSLGTGTIINNGELAFNRSDNISFGQVISGTGGLVQLGSGTLTLTAVNTYTGPTTINAGTLSVNGSIPSSPVTVNSGGTLGGNGSTGAVTVNSGGQIAPGNSIGTVTVSSLTLKPGSITTIELSPSASDRINVAGAAALDGTLTLSPAAGAYSPASYRLIQAGSISGTFANITGQVAGFTNTVQYSATAVDLILATGSGSGTAPVTTFLFGSYANTANGIAAGNALTAGSPSAALYTAMGGLVKSNVGAVPAALGQLAGDIRPSLRAAAVEDSRIVRDTLLDHMRRGGEGVVLWVAGFGGYGGITGDGNSESLHHDDAGFLAGADLDVLPELRLGVAAGYTANSAHTASRFSAASGDAGHIAAYMDWRSGNFSLDAGGDYGFGSVHIARVINGLGFANADTQDQETGQIFVDAGYRVPLDEAVLEPHATLAHVIASSGAFTESGDVSALSGGSASDSRTYAIFGLRGMIPDLKLDDMNLTPRLDVGWQHALGHFAPGQTVALVNASQNFLVLGTPLARDAASIQAGFDLSLGETTLFVTYDGSFASSAESHAFRGGLNWQF